jgi:hypothetical protein
MWSQVPGSNAEVYPWILALGGTGIVVGLATYGYNSESPRCCCCCCVWLRSRRHINMFWSRS